MIRACFLCLALLGRFSFAMEFAPGDYLSEATKDELEQALLKPDWQERASQILGTKPVAADKDFLSIAVGLKDHRDAEKTAFLLNHISRSFPSQMCLITSIINYYMTPLPLDSYRAMIHAIDPNLMYVAGQPTRVFPEYFTALRKYKAPLLAISLANAFLRQLIIHYATQFCLNIEPDEEMKELLLKAGIDCSK